MPLGFGKPKQLDIAPQKTGHGGTTRPKTMTKKRTLAVRTISMVMKRIAFKADCERYRRYAEAKQRIPKTLSPAEYEAAVAKLAKKYRI